MPAFRALVERVRATPPRRLPGRVIQTVLRKMWLSRRRRADRRRPTTLSDARFDALLRTVDGGDPGGLSGGWPSILGRRSISEALDDGNRAGVAGLSEVATRFRQHRFDLLGSGWTHVDYHTEAAGAFGYRYEMAAGRAAEQLQVARMGQLLDEAASHVGDASPGLARLRSTLEQGEYRPIDWHLDFKSGYRWGPLAWYMDVPFGHLGGVDIKVPWELSRGHHLVTLALDAASGGPEEATAREIALQLLDWIAANPPRRGVNWRTAMDTGIRAANWVWALSVLGETPAVPPAVRWLVAKSLYQHGAHIMDNLEHQADYTTNHYLADIVGLLHIAFTYPEFPESGRWLAFCLQELVSEMRSTVLPDGVNYELSTGYHRLVAEMFAHGTLLAMRLSPRQRASIASASTREHTVRPRLKPIAVQEFDLDSTAVFPDWYRLRLRRMFGYVADITKPNGLAVQFGDQDSGRLLKLSWVGGTEDGGDPREEPRDHRHLLAVGARMFGDPRWAANSADYALDGLIAALGVPGLPMKAPEEDAHGPVRCSATGEPGEPVSVWYPNGGTCVMRRGAIWLAVRCVPGRSVGPTAHRHNDQLSFELNIAGTDLIVDWGTGVYTADPAVRNRLRATSSHSTAAPSGREQNRLVGARAGMFVLHDRTAAACLRVEAARFTGEHQGFGAPHRRTVSLLDHALVVEDVLDTHSGYELTLTLADAVTPYNANASAVVELKAGPVSAFVEVEPPAPGITVERATMSPAYGLLKDSHVVRFDRPSGVSRLTVRLAPTMGKPG